MRLDFLYASSKKHYCHAAWLRIKAIGRLLLYVWSQSEMTLNTRSRLTDRKLLFCSWGIYTFSTGGRLTIKKRQCLLHCLGVHRVHSLLVEVIVPAIQLRDWSHGVYVTVWLDGSEKCRYVRYARAGWRYTTIKSFFMADGLVKCQTLCISDIATNVRWLLVTLARRRDLRQSIVSVFFGTF